MFDLGAGVHNGTFTLINYTSEAGGNNAPAATNYLFKPPAGFNAAHFALNDTGSTITLTVTGEAQDVTWTGNVSPNWNTTQQNSKPPAGLSCSTTTASSSTTILPAPPTSSSMPPASPRPSSASTPTPPTPSPARGQRRCPLQVRLGHRDNQQHPKLQPRRRRLRRHAQDRRNRLHFRRNVALSGGSTLELGATSNIAGVASFSFADSILRADGSLAINHPITITGAGIGLDVDTQGNNVTFGGSCTAASTTPLEKDGTGTLLFSAPTAMSGSITINGGTLATALGTTGITSGTINVNPGATLELRSNQAGYTGSNLLTVNMDNNTTLKYSGESGILGGNGVTFLNQTFVGKDVYIRGADANSRLVTRNYLKNSYSEGDAATTIHLTNAGMVHVASGSLAVTTTNKEFSGTWQLDNGFTGVLQVGPLLNTNNTEVLVGLGYNVGFPAGPTRPVIVNSGTLAVGADARDTRTGTANAATNISGDFPKPRHARRRQHRVHRPRIRDRLQSNRRHRRRQQQHPRDRNVCRRYHTHR